MLQSLSKRDLLARTLDVTGGGRALRAVGAWDGILILNYHRVGDSSQSLFDRNLWSATDADFEARFGLGVPDAGGEVSEGRLRDGGEDGRFGIEVGPWRAWQIELKQLLPIQEVG